MMHQAITKGGAVSWLLLVFDKEDNVEEVCGDQGKVEAKDCCPANLEEESCPLCLERKIQKAWQLASPGFSCEPQSAFPLLGHRTGMHQEQPAWLCFF